MNVSYQSKDIVLPDFLVIGGMRCGTTSLYQYLVNHPEIFMPSLKEPHFFSYVGTDIAPHPDEIKKGPWTFDQYAALFRHSAPDQIIGEASTSYLYRYPQSIQAVRDIYAAHCSRIKIVGILRNPVDRAWSIYLLKRQGGDWNQDFLSVADTFLQEGNQYQYYNFIASGRYSEQVQAWRDAFPECRFYLFEELAADAGRIVRECLELFGVKDTTPPQNVGKIYNYSGLPRGRLTAPFYRILFQRFKLKEMLKPFVPESVRFHLKTGLGRKLVRKAVMPVEARQTMQGLFRDDIERLAAMFPPGFQRDTIAAWLSPSP